MIKKLKINFKDKKSVLAVFGILSAVLLTTAASYAWFSYSGTGRKENTISSGSISFHYQEGNRTISLSDGMPIPDSQGKSSENYFDFQVKGTTGNSKISYEVTARKTDSSSNIDNSVKVYLTKVEGNKEEQKVLSMYSSLTQSQNALAQNHTEKTLLRGTIPAESTEYTENYRLRMWLNNDTNDGNVLEYTQTVTGVCSDTTYTTREACVAAHKDWTDTATGVENTFTLKVNVYANGELATEQEIVDANSTALLNVRVNNNNATRITEEGINYDFEIGVPDGTTNANIDVTPAYEGATITNIEDMSNTASNTKIQKLSTSKSFVYSGMDNYYKITVRSANKKNTKDYKVRVRYTYLNEKILADNTVRTDGPDLEAGAETVILSYSQRPFTETPAEYTLTSTFQDHYYTYASDYSFDTTTGKYSLVNPQVCQWKNCYNSLIGKYVVSFFGNSSSSAANSTNLTGIYKVVDTAADTIYYQFAGYIENYDTSHSGMYSMNVTNGFGGANGTTYYFRGLVDNNNVRFAGKKWKIIRINEDGTVRLIIVEGEITNCNWHNNSDNSDIMNMYYTNSNAKVCLEDWYSANITGDNASKVASGNYYCEEAKVKLGNYINTGNNTMQYNLEYTPELLCGTDGYGKGLVNSNIGLINYDELILAGYLAYNPRSTVYASNNYLQSVAWWATMSPAGIETDHPNIWTVSNVWFRDNSTSGKWRLRQVINIKADTIATGTGTESDPYVIQ